MMDAFVQEMLDEVFSSLEALETQTEATLQFLKDRKLASEKDLAPFFEKRQTQVMLGGAQLAQG